jgi:hypothetical protein
LNHLRIYLESFLSQLNNLNHMIFLSLNIRCLFKFQLLNTLVFIFILQYAHSQEIEYKKLKISKPIGNNSYNYIPNFATPGPEDARIKGNERYVFLLSKHELIKINTKKDSIECKNVFDERQEILSSTIDDKDRLWYISNESLYLFQDSVKMIHLPDKFVKPISVVFRESDEIYILGVFENKLYVYKFLDTTYERKFLAPEEIDFNRNVFLTINHNRELVLTGYNYYYTSQDFERWSEKIKLNSPTEKIAFDKSGNMLLRANGGGHYHLYYKSVSDNSYNIPRHLFVYETNLACFDRNDNIITKDGSKILFLKKPFNTVDSIKLPDEISRVSGLLTTNDGNVWSYSNIGLLKISTNNIIVYQFPFDVTDLFFSFNSLGFNHTFPPLVIDFDTFKAFHLTDKNIPRIKELTNWIEIDLRRYNYHYRALKIDNKINTVFFNPYLTDKGEQPKIEIVKYTDKKEVYTFQISDKKISAKDIKIVANSTNNIWIAIKNQLFQFSVNNNEWKEIQFGEEIIPAP